MDGSTIGFDSKTNAYLNGFAVDKEYQSNKNKIKSFEGVFDLINSLYLLFMCYT